MSGFDAVLMTSGPWRADDLALLAALAGLFCLLAANAAAALKIYSGVEPVSAKRLWLAALWALPVVGLAMWGLWSLRRRPLPG